MGFALFFLLEQIINWHYIHHIESHDIETKGEKKDNSENLNQINSADQKEPFTYLILIADGIHNFIGGIAIASSFLIGIEVGLITWIASAAHEIPQELGDFGILIHGGWNKKKAILFNFISALTIVPGALLVYYTQFQISIAIFLAFAAGNFVYLAAADLLPEITHGQAHEKAKKEKKSKDIIKNGLINFTCFSIGLILIILTRFLFHRG